MLPTCTYNHTTTTCIHIHLREKSPMLKESIMCHLTPPTRVCSLPDLVTQSYMGTAEEESAAQGRRWDRGFRRNLSVTRWL